MTYPPDDVMHSFHALSQAVGVTTDDGAIEAAIPDPDALNCTRWHEITGEQLDELVRRGWVVLIGADEIEASDNGVYWLRRWCAQQDKLKRKGAVRRS